MNTQFLTDHLVLMEVLIMSVEFLNFIDKNILRHLSALDVTKLKLLFVKKQQSLTEGS